MTLTNTEHGTRNTIMHHKSYSSYELADIAQEAALLQLERPGLSAKTAYKTAERRIQRAYCKYMRAAMNAPEMRSGRILSEEQVVTVETLNRAKALGYVNGEKLKYMWDDVPFANYAEYVSYALNCE